MWDDRDKSAGRCVGMTPFVPRGKLLIKMSLALSRCVWVGGCACVCAPPHLYSLLPISVPDIPNTLVRPLGFIIKLKGEASKCLKGESFGFARSSART